MRINLFIAKATGMSRRTADAVVASGRVQLNGLAPSAGAQASETDIVLLDGKQLKLPEQPRTIMLNKPVGYVCSRDGQGSRTVYELLPQELHALKPVGRLDKDSSGLLLLTNDGTLAHQLTHPSFEKTKVYEVTLRQPLAALHHQMIADVGVQLEDGPSCFALERMSEGNDFAWRVTMREGRNRQIRRTFSALGYTVAKLHRTQFGQFKLGQLRSGSYVDEKTAPSPR